VYWIVWSFDVKPEQVKAFERVYGPQGEWIQLFGRAPGFAGSELRRETDRVGHYLTIDRWQSRADYQQFQDAFGSEYDRLDTKCKRMADVETKIGDFETTTNEL
jgi:heme-degrading monooxygenase HmoA